MIMVEYDRTHNPHRAGGHYSHQPHRGSPHLQHLEHPSTHSTPSPPYQYASLPHMAVQQPQHPQPVRSTPTSYPSPASYPSPSVSAYQYPPQPAPSQQPVSRGSPYSQSASINLPPIRLNPPAQLPPPPHEGSPLLGSPLPPPPQQPMHSYYPHALPPPAMHHGQMSSPIHQPLRYPLPSVANPERIMSGGRHKKEIKRRTKTGCLTCRKRRIKCDEGHPTCKNCQKSKRDCLGYDPIFKAQPGPAAIQPAPSGVGGPSYPHATSTAGSSPTSSCDTYDYPQIDPSLDATSHPHIPPPPLPDTHTYRPELKRTIDRTSPFSSASDTTRTPYTPIPRSATPGGLSRHQDLTGSNPAKRIKIGDLLSVGSLSSATAQPLSPPASELAATIASNSVESLKNIYKARYAPAVDDFLETDWFKKNGVRKMCSDSQLAEVMAEVFERLKARGGSYAEEEDPSIRRSGRDSDILWAAIKMCYGTKIPASDTRREESTSAAEVRDDEGLEALRRINIVESLVTGTPLEHITSSPIEIARDSGMWSSDASQFWTYLGRLVSLKKDAARGEVMDLLNECHKRMGQKDSRKLLYSIAEARFLSADQKQNPHQMYIEDIARSHAPISSLDRRIAGRAMGLWGIAFTDAPFCMPAV